MIRVPVALLLVLGCTRDTPKSAYQLGQPEREPGAPKLQTQSAQELQTVLARIDDLTITLGEFQERINRQSPTVRQRYT